MKASGITKKALSGRIFPTVHFGGGKGDLLIFLFFGLPSLELLLPPLGGGGDKGLPLEWSSPTLEISKLCN